MSTSLHFAPSGIFASLTSGSGATSAATVAASQSFFIKADVVATPRAFHAAMPYNLTIVVTNLTNGVTLLRHHISGNLGDSNWPTEACRIEVAVTAGTVGDFYNLTALLTSGTVNDYAFGRNVIAVSAGIGH